MESSMMIETLYKNIEIYSLIEAVKLRLQKELYGIFL